MPTVLEFGKIEDAGAWVLIPDAEVRYDDLTWDKQRKSGQIRSLNVGYVTVWHVSNEFRIEGTELQTDPNELTISAACSTTSPE